MQTIDSAKNRISLASLIWIIKHCVFYISFRDYGSVSAVVGKFTLSLSLSLRSKSPRAVFCLKVGTTYYSGRWIKRHAKLSRSQESPRGAKYTGSLIRERRSF